MNAPDPKANTTTEAYLAYKAGYLEESELKPVLYEPYLHFDAWLAYWAGLTSDYPKNYGKNLCQELSGFNSISSNGATNVVKSGNSVSFTTSANGTGIFMTSTNGNNYTYCPELYSTGYVCSVEISATKASQLWIGVETMYETVDVDTTPKRVSFKCYGNAGERVALIFYRANTSGECSYTISNIQVEKGSEATDFEECSITPEMLTDEEALVAYLSGVTDTYSEEIKDPYDPRIVGYLRHIASIRFDAPDYPVNNEEFYLSTMEPTHTSNSEPSADIELDTTDGNIISVEAYGDTKQQTYSGKNLTNFTTISFSGANSGSATRDGGTLTVTCSDSNANSGVQFSQASLMLEPDTTYTFSAKITSTTSTIGSAVYVSNAMIGESSGIFGNQANAGEISSVTFTTASSIPSNASIRLYGREAGATAVFTDLQIEKSSTATTYEPYVGGVPAPNPDYPQDVNVVTGEQTITVTGKNQANPSAPVVYRNNNQITATPLETGIMISHPDNGTNKQIGFLTQINLTSYVGKTIRMKASFEAAHSGEYRLYRTNENGGDRVSMAVTTSSGTEISFVVPEDLGSSPYLAFVLMLVNNVALSVSFTDLIITIDNDDMSFIPYQTPQSFTINLGSTELCKIGDYQDYIYKNGDDWYLHKVIDKSMLGDLSWFTEGTASTVGAYRLGSNGIASVVLAPSTNADVFNGLCTNYIPVSVDGSGTYGGVVGIGIKRTGTISVYDTSYNTSTSDTDFKTWLTNNNVALYYTLATPTDTQITDATLIGQLDALAGADTYDEKTYIKVTATDPNLPALLEVEAYKY